MTRGHFQLEFKPPIMYLIRRDKPNRAHLGGDHRLTGSYLEGAAMRFAITNQDAASLKGDVHPLVEIKTDGIS
jgi:hypothetical protein